MEYLVFYLATVCMTDYIHRFWCLTEEETKFQHRYLADMCFYGIYLVSLKMSLPLNIEITPDISKEFVRRLN